jgi:hypothetical protein
VKTASIAAVAAMVGILAAILPAAIWIGRLQEQVANLQHQVQSCASKEVQDAHDSWIKSWSEDTNRRLNRLERQR